MNRARAAAARAKMHEAIDELFDALEDRVDAPPTAAPSRPKVIRPVNDIDKARARKALRKLGVDL